MLSFEPDKPYLRKLLIYFFILKKFAAEAHRFLVDRSERPKVYEAAELEQYDGQYFE